MLGLPFLPAFTSTNTTGTNILNGVNYASAGAGILDESGRHLVMPSNLAILQFLQTVSLTLTQLYNMTQGDRFTLTQQVQNFQTTLNQLKSQMNAEQLSQYLAKSLVVNLVMILGSNDYINNYLLPSLYPTTSKLKPKDYADLLINRYTQQILV